MKNRPQTEDCFHSISDYSWVCHITKNLSSLEYQVCSLKEVQGNLGQADSAPRPPATSTNTTLQAWAVPLGSPWIPLGHCRVRLHVSHVSHVSQRHSNFYTSCNHLQSFAIRLRQNAFMLTPQKITHVDPFRIHFGSFQQIIEIHFGVSNSAHGPKHSRSFLSCALPSLFNFHKVPLNCGACDCGTMVARPSG